MPSKETKILQFNEYKKPDKAKFIICANIECLKEILKIHVQQNLGKIFH